MDTNPASTRAEALKIEHMAAGQNSPEAAWKALARDCQMNKQEMTSVLSQVARDDKTNQTYVLPSLTIAYHKDQLTEAYSHNDAQSPQKAALFKNPDVGQAIDSAYNTAKAQEPAYASFTKAMNGGNDQLPAGANEAVNANAQVHNYLRAHPYHADRTNSLEIQTAEEMFLKDATTKPFADTAGNVTSNGLKTLQNALNNTFPAKTRDDDRNIEYNLAGEVEQYMQSKHITSLTPTQLQGLFAPKPAH